MKVVVANKYHVEDLAKAFVEANLADRSLDEVICEFERSIKRGVVLFAIKDKNILGFMSGVVSHYFWVKKNVACETWFFIRPEFRDLGVARNLVRAFESWSRLKNCDYVNINPCSFGSLDMGTVANALGKLDFKEHSRTMIKEVSRG